MNPMVGDLDLFDGLGGIEQWRLTRSPNLRSHIRTSRRRIAECSMSAFVARPQFGVVKPPWRMGDVWAAGVAIEGLAKGAPAAETAGTSRSIVSKSSWRLMGLLTYPSMPADKHRSRSPMIALAVRAMMVRWIVPPAVRSASSLRKA